MQQIFLQPFFLIMHQYNFITHSSKFDCVTYSELVSFSLIEIVIWIQSHVLHAKPKLITRVCFLFLSGFYLVLVINPVIIVLEKYGCTAWNKIVRHWYHF